MKVNKEIAITCEKSRLEDKILPLLKEKVFHVTSSEAYQAMVGDGMIKSNINSCYKYTFPQSEVSYGVKRGYICLFDLRNKSDDVVEKALMKFYFLKPFHYQNVSVFLILSPRFYSNLIYDTQEEIGWKEIYIPHVECWYPGNIPLEYIDEVIEVTTTEF